MAQEITTIRSDADALKSLEDWASTWNTAEPVPVEVRPKLDAALRAAQVAVAPATIEQLAVELDKLRAFAQAFGIPDRTLGDAAAIYRDTLGDLPPDLLADAMRAALTRHEGYRRLPLPAEIRKHVSEELTQRHLVASRLEFAQRKAQRQRAEGGPPTRYVEMTPDQRRAHDDRMAALRAALAGNSDAIRRGAPAAGEAA